MISKTKLPKLRNVNLSRTVEGYAGISKYCNCGNYGKIALIPQIGLFRWLRFAIGSW